MQQITPLPLLCTDVLPVSESVNPEDKAILAGGGPVTEGTEAVARDVDDTPGEGSNNPGTVSKTTHELHRSMRERKASKALTDFVCF
ncbi:hypothetical protein PVK06_048231 [Gossypium arboreum]|uniref:Uncharacterized protein n=1 Tax=Gossypium arboreum TaxID=29729 RepID=A0ABR0MFW1_GOSAR|nr:hypothetical protein PVK06_048231 [Gossypium arboreum]